MHSNDNRRKGIDNGTSTHPSRSDANGVAARGPADQSYAVLTTGALHVSEDTVNEGGERQLFVGDARPLLSRFPRI